MFERDILYNVERRKNPASAQNSHTGGAWQRNLAWLLFAIARQHNYCSFRCVYISKRNNVMVASTHSLDAKRTQTPSQYLCHDVPSILCLGTRPRHISDTTSSGMPRRRWERSHSLGLRTLYTDAIGVVAAQVGSDLLERCKYSTGTHRARHREHTRLIESFRFVVQVHPASHSQGNGV